MSRNPEKVRMSIRLCLDDRYQNKGSFWKGGLFEDVHILASSEILDTLESPQSVGNQVASNHF